MPPLAPARRRLRRSFELPPRSLRGSAGADEGDARVLEEGGVSFDVHGAPAGDVRGAVGEGRRTDAAGDGRVHEHGWNCNDELGDGQSINGKYERDS